MNGCRIRAGAKVITGCHALLAIVVCNPYFDQFVRRKGAIDFCRDRIGDTGAADVHNGFERVRA